MISANSYTFIVYDTEIDQREGVGFEITVQARRPEAAMDKAVEVYQCMMATRLRPVTKKPFHDIILTRIIHNI